MGIKEIHHNKKIVHRDLKPENIFMNDNMNIKLGNFCISKQLNLDKTYAKNKSRSDYYIAPELLIKGIYNEKSDIWSLGCIIYELFTLNIFSKDKSFDEIKKINSDIYNNKWQKFIDSLLQIDYNKRFDINQVIEFLEDKLNIKDSNENKIININSNNNKVIIGRINIKNEDITKDIRIINSFENAKREKKWKVTNDDIKYLNEKEIKENIEIKINGKIIDFTYYYKFDKEGKYIIEYSFKNNLTKTCCMFFDCKSLISLDLSNFNTQNVTNMSWMFYRCNSLKSLDLSNFNNQNVTDMNGMFYDCKSLTNLNLSNFNTQNVTNMNGMFCNCKSLTNLNISNFNTQNVTNMNGMFKGCFSLTYINLSNLNTQNVKDMGSMFYFCYSLTNLNLSNFNTQNVTKMSSMFEGCYSLTNLNLSNFNTQNVINMWGMFYDCKSLRNLNLSSFKTNILTNLNFMFEGCHSLLNKNLITKDANILEKLI